MASESAVVLMSGGIDSATCAAIAARNVGTVIPVHVRYGQQTGPLEQDMAAGQLHHLQNQYPDAAFYEMTVVDYSNVFSHFAEGVADPGKEFEELNEDDGRSTGYVPMRNLHLIATAAAFADKHGAEYVYHGAQGGDEADYPDCRPQFMSAAREAIQRSVPAGQDLTLRVPLLRYRKPEVIERANDVRVAFELTYSCYRETDPDDPDPCGQCPACLERAEAFDQASIEDPHGTEVTR